MFEFELKIFLERGQLDAIRFRDLDEAPSMAICGDPSVDHPRQLVRLSVNVLSGDPQSHDITCRLVEYLEH